MSNVKNNDGELITINEIGFIYFHPNRIVTGIYCRPVVCGYLALGKACAWHIVPADKDVHFRSNKQSEEKRKREIEDGPIPT